MASSASSVSRTPAPPRATRTTSSGATGPGPTSTRSALTASWHTDGLPATIRPGGIAVRDPRRLVTVDRMSGVPAARQALAVLQAMARLAGPVPAAALARDLGLPRSTTYHLLAELQAAGFVVHLPEERRYGLGVSAFELGSAYLRQEPLARLARPVLGRLVDAVGCTAHLAVLHGRGVLYVVEERAPGRPPLVTEIRRASWW